MELGKLFSSALLCIESDNTDNLTYNGAIINFTEEKNIRRMSVTIYVIFF